MIRSQYEYVQSPCQFVMYYIGMVFYIQVGQID